MSAAIAHDDHATAYGVAPVATGVATAIPRRAPLSHFHAHRLPLGDVVMACTQYTNPVTFAPAMQQVRVFRADAADRSKLASFGADTFMQCEGALAYASLDLRSDLDYYPFDIPSDRVARLTEFRVAGNAAGDRAQVARQGLAEWLLETLETELVHAAYFAIKGDSRSFWPATRLDTVDWHERYHSSDYGLWAADWLESRGYAVFRDDPGQFFLVFNPPLLELIEAGEVA